jgi:hypothetical protein
MLAPDAIKMKLANNEEFFSQITVVRGVTRRATSSWYVVAVGRNSKVGRIELILLDFFMSRPAPQLSLTAARKSQKVSPKVEIGRVNRLQSFSEQTPAPKQKCDSPALYGVGLLLPKNGLLLKNYRFTQDYRCAGKTYLFRVCI